MKEDENSRITVGLFAHVDSGKTTLAEALLYASGALREAGRVDHGSAFLDNDQQERARGITIFSGEAELTAGERDMQLLDTPGHVDFGAEMERALSVIDLAVLVVSGRRPVQGYTVTLWKLLQRHGLPVFLFVNKMDLEGTDREQILRALQEGLDERCVPADPEEMAMCGEELLEEYLAEGKLADVSLRKAVAERLVFPCFFGSALRMDGTDALLKALDRWGPDVKRGGTFSARVCRITRDEDGRRLTHLKVTGGSLSVRDELKTGEDEDGPVTEKITQLRIYSGKRHRSVDRVNAGTLCAAAGLQRTFVGQGLGEEKDLRTPSLQPVINVAVKLPEGRDVRDALSEFRILQEEDPQLHVSWDGRQERILLRLMGDIQKEILQKTVEDRFGYTVEFQDAGVDYRETINSPVRGAGHFEPLRHYAEVHLLLEPLPAGSGMEFASSCSSDELETRWQRLILTHLQERDFPGVLTGSPLTDARITVEGGKAHPKHTEGGDFRQATYRAVRQALRKGESLLLEPWVDFQLEIPADCVGRAMADIQRMGGSLGEQRETGDRAGTNMILVTGSAPAMEMRDYAIEVRRYSGGNGDLFTSFGGYRPCHNEDEVRAEIAYDPDRDPENTGDSIFCSHGAGRSVPWDEADSLMHVQIRDREHGGGSTEHGEPGARARETEIRREHGPGGAAGSGPLSRKEEKELERIFEKTYGPSKARSPGREARTFEAGKKRASKDLSDYREECLLVDGYNIIFAWEELKDLAGVSIDASREALLEILSNLQGYRGGRIIAVFDAYKVKGNAGHTEQRDNITVVYTAESETADTWIERATYEEAGKYRIRVATSDRQEQMIASGNDALRISAAELKKEVGEMDERIRDILKGRRRELERVDRKKIDLPGN